MHTEFPRIYREPLPLHREPITAQVKRRAKGGAGAARFAARGP
jgi:hypothetical protein